MTEEERQEGRQPEPEPRKEPRQDQSEVERKILTGSEEVRKLAENYEYKPPRNLRPILAEDQPASPPTAQSDPQETQQE